MKKTILIFLFLLFSNPVFAIGNDKIIHATGSYVSTNIFMELGMSKKQAFWSMVLLGAIKETFDNNTPEEHAKDMAANIVGAGGAVIMFRWEYNKGKWRFKE